MGIYHAGRWTILVTTQEYKEHSDYEKKDHADRLDMTDDKKDGLFPAKKQKHSSIGGGVEVEGRNTIVCCSYNGVTIMGEGGGSLSFMNLGGFSGNEKKN